MDQYYVLQKPEIKLCSECIWKAEQWELRKENINSVIEKIGVGKRYKDCTLDNFKNGEKYIKFCRNWLKNPYESLFFTGPFGCGKTHLAIGICRELLLCCEIFNAYNDQIFFEYSIDLLYQIRKTFSSSDDTDGLIKQFTMVDYMVIDDLGAEKTTEWSIETLSLIIDRRDRELKPTIITSNLSLSEVAEKISGRIASRIANGKIIKIEMPDYRKKRAVHV